MAITSLSELLVALLAAAAIVVFLMNVLVALWRRVEPGQPFRRLAIIVLALVFIVAPFVALDIHGRGLARKYEFARVPKPLEGSRVEYRSEQIGVSGRETTRGVSSFSG